METKFLAFQGNVVRFASVEADVDNTRDKYAFVDALLSTNFRPEDIRKLKMSPIDRQETTVSIQTRGGNMKLQMYYILISWKAGIHDT